MSDHEETAPKASVFDASAYPEDTLFHERRVSGERRRGPASEGPPGRTPRSRTPRRRRIDPTTFEKQYTADEIEFMNAVQRFKERSGKAFPSHGDTLRIAFELGYRRVRGPVDAPAPPPAPEGNAPGR